MRRFLFPVALSAMVALSTLGQAEPIMLWPEADLQADPEPPRGDPSTWFFGDGGFGCPRWWCDDTGAAAADLAPQRAPRLDPGNWFFGDGPLGCSQGQCDRYRRAPEAR